MAAKLPVWGIDVGQCSLKAMKLQVAGEGVELAEFDIIEHEGILSQAGPEANAMVRAAIEKFLSKHDVKGTRVVVSVPGQQTLTRFIKMPPVETKKIPDMVKYEAGQQIPFDMDEVVWDYQVFQEPDSPDIEVGIFAIRRELIRNHLAQFTELGIEPVVAQAGPMASYNAIKFDQPPPEGESMVLLDMGAVSTDLIVMTGNTIWSRPVPIGGNRFTEALVSAFKISFKKAEELKRSAASSKYARQIFQAMRPVFADLVSEIQRSIGSYTSNHREANITRALGMGNAFKLPGLQKFLQQNLQIDFNKLAEFSKLSTGSIGQSPEFVENQMSCAMAYGLALQGLEMSAVDSNLLPPEVRKALLWSKKKVWFGAAAACLAGAAATIWGANSMAMSTLDGGMGSVTTPSVTNVPLPQAGDVIAQGQGGQKDVEYLAKVGGAAQALKNEFSRLGSGADADQALLTEVSKLPSNNTILAVATQTIQKIVNSSMGEDVRKAASASEYVQTVLDDNRVPKKQRKARDEVWVESLQMSYDTQNADIAFGNLVSADTGTTVVTPNGKPGWAVALVCGTTKETPSQWIQDALIHKLEVEGRRPGRGFYFDRLALTYVKLRPLSGESSTAMTGMPVSPTVGARGGMRAGGGGGRVGERDTPPGMGTPTTPEGPQRVKTIQELIAAMDFKPGFDPVTGEPTTADSVFEIRFVIIPSDTPAELIPAEFKPKDAAPADAGQPKPTQPPRRP